MVDTTYTRQGQRTKGHTHTHTHTHTYNHKPTHCTRTHIDQHHTFNMTITRTRPLNAGYKTQQTNNMTQHAMQSQRVEPKGYLFGAPQRFAQAKLVRTGSRAWPCPFCTASGLLSTAEPTNPRHSSMLSCSRIIPNWEALALHGSRVGHTPFVPSQDSCPRLNLQFSAFGALPARELLSDWGA
jgi:hypothetical protein